MSFIKDENSDNLNLKIFSFENETINSGDDIIRNLKDENGRLMKLLQEKDFEINKLKRDYEKYNVKNSEKATLGEGAAALKIIELSKKLREMTSELESLKSKYSQELKENKNLEIILAHLSSSNEKNVSLPTHKTFEELRHLKEKLKCSEFKVLELLTTNQNLSKDYKIIVKMQKEKQQIMIKQEQECNALKEDNVKLKQTCDSLKSRNQSLTNDIKSCKQQIKTMLDKTKNDDELIASLIHRQDQLKMTIQSLISNSHSVQINSTYDMTQAAAQSKQDIDKIENLKEIIELKEMEIKSMKESKRIVEEMNEEISSHSMELEISQLRQLITTNDMRYQSILDKSKKIAEIFRITRRYLKTKHFQNNNVEKLNSKTIWKISGKETENCNVQYFDKRKPKIKNHNKSMKYEKNYPQRVERELPEEFRCRLKRNCSNDLARSFSNDSDLESSTISRTSTRSSSRHFTSSSYTYSSKCSSRSLSRRSSNSSVSRTSSDVSSRKISNKEFKNDFDSRNYHRGKNISNIPRMFRSRSPIKSRIKLNCNDKKRSRNYKSNTSV